MEFALAVVGADGYGAGLHGGWRNLRAVDSLLEVKIEEIREAIRAERYLVSRHSFEEADVDRLEVETVLDSVVRTGEIIEDYPKREPLPRCLVLGFTRNGIPVHSVWEVGDLPGWVAIVTVYRPNPAEWIEWRHRR